MRIVYLVTRAEPIGGAQVHVRDLATEMLRRGHAPTVVVGGGGAYAEDLRARGIPVISSRYLTAPIRPWLDLRAFQEVKGIVRELNPVLLSAHGAKVGMLGRVVARSLGLPLIVTVHGWACAPGTPPVQAFVSRSLERLIGRLANKVITVSEFDRVFGLQARLVAPGQVITVHNGMPDIAVALRADPRRSPPRLAMIARFEPQKDHMTLFQALAGLRDRPWQLDLIGDGPLRGEMEIVAEKLGIKNRIRFLGQLPDVAPILAQAQLSLLISNWEGFPRSILESMRAGLPVIASAVGGVAESVRDQETGYVVPRGEVSLLKDRLAALLDQPELRARLGSQARTRYEQQFTLEHLVAKTFAVYQEVLGPRARSEGIDPHPASAVP
jgi:glycosyltransferase involved in cell wall biosynthesis